jgi:hypothetical protein
MRLRNPLTAGADQCGGLDPAGGARNAILEIDVAGLREAGYYIPEVARVTSANGMAGGGYEIQFPYEVPPEYIKALRP